jgi:hypothetical protein
VDELEDTTFSFTNRVNVTRTVDDTRRREPNYVPGNESTLKTLPIQSKAGAMGRISQKK